MDVAEGESVRIRLSDESQLQKLVAFLAFDANVILTQIGPDEVEVSFLGSLNTSAPARTAPFAAGKPQHVVNPEVLKG